MMVSTHTTEIKMVGERKENCFLCQFTTGYDKSYTGTSSIPTDEILTKIMDAQRNMEPGDLIRIEFKIKYGSPKGFRNSKTAK